jgi:hypothetical protein
METEADRSESLRSLKAESWREQTLEHVREKFQKKITKIYLY